MWGRKIIKSRLFFNRICLSLYDCQAKASRYRMWLKYMKNRATTSKPSNTFTKNKGRGHKHKIKGNHHSKERKKERKKENNKEETESTGKQALKWQ